MFPAGFEWNPAKAMSNADKHGVRFAVAVEVFADPEYLELGDHVRDGEVRTNIIGRVRGVLLFVTFTRRGANIRLISARLAGRRERDAYHPRADG